MKNIILLLITFISSTFFTQNIVQLNGKFILKNGLPLEGTFQNYDELGNLKFTYELLDGVQNGNFISFHDNGFVKENGNYKLGVKVGSWKYFNEDGILITEISYDNFGKKDGTWKVWNQYGDLSTVMIYESGNRIGIWKSLNKEGQIAQKINY